jgi:hypothetical protein
LEMHENYREEQGDSDLLRGLFENSPEEVVEFPHRTWSETDTQPYYHRAKTAKRNRFNYPLV